MEVKMIDMKDIDRETKLQCRKTFDHEKLIELANSIHEGELLQPIVVRKYDGKYRIVCGERRYRAFEYLKEPKIPAIVREIKDDTDALEKGLIENLQRDDLTSVERENAISELWKSGRYKNYNELARKLGIDSSGVSHILGAKEFREKSGIEPEITTAMIHATSGLNNEPRKKLLKLVDEGKIGKDYNKVLDAKRKLKEFPKPEQQMEILEEFEQQENQSKETFDRIIQQKKEIAHGEREPEHIIQVETNTDQRLIDSYKQIKSNVFEIYHDHILHMKSDTKRKEAIKVLWDIHNFIDKELKALGEIKVVN